MNILFLSLSILFVFLFYFHTLFYGVKLFDEIIPFKETYLPVCFSLNEMFELISNLGLNHYFEATNTLYSNITSLRCNSFGTFHTLLTQVIFKKNPVGYHSYSLLLHLVNTGFIFLIINNTGIKLIQSTKPSTIRLLIASIFSVLWAVHPVNIESVLLLTNYNTLFSYTLCFFVTYIYLGKIFDSKTFTSIKYIFAFILYLFALFTAEFHFMLPLILVSYEIALCLYLKYKSAVVIKTTPLFIASILFILFFILSNKIINIKVQSSLELTLERVFWLSPQIFFHFVKLIFVPIKLSIDQSLLVHIAKSLFDPYVIFCFVFALLILFFSIRSLLKANKYFPFFFIIFFPFTFSLIPFSHVIAPLYNLASERYLYFPSFLLILGFSSFTYFLLNRKEIKPIFLITTLLLITTTYSSRAFIRTLAWKDSPTLYYSAIKTTNNSLNKAFRYKGLTPQNKIHLKYPEYYVDPKYIKLALKNLTIAIKKLKTEEEKYQLKLPAIVKSYGLDPSSLLAKANYYLAQTNYTLNKDNKKALELISPYTNSSLNSDSSILSFYAGLLYFNNNIEKVEEVLRKALEITPYSTRIIFPLCDIIQIKYKDINEIEELTLRAFNYFPYDTYTLYRLSKLYKLKNDLKRFAYFSYLYGLRHHSIQGLINAEKTYLHLGDKVNASNARKRIVELKKYLK